MSKYLFRVYLIFLNFVFALSCDPGYIEVEGFCINISNCPTNCLSCQISTTCDTCLPGYYLQVSAFFTKCEACSDGCKVCSSNNNCSICFPNYYISGLICQPCPIQCATCTSNNVCQTCKDSYYMIGTMCSVCDTSCKTCLGTISTCTSCDDGKYLSVSQCFPCSSPCATCVNNANDCTSCIGYDVTLVNNKCVCDDGFYVDASNQCQPCSEPCANCVNNANDCTSCIGYDVTLVNNKCVCDDGFYVDASNQCQPCSEPCATCVNNANDCTSCIGGDLTLVNNQCVCDDGFYADASNQCQPCSSPCSTCVNNANDCTSCIGGAVTLVNNQCVCDDGFYADASNYCQPCTAPCSKCQYNATNCTGCILTYTLSQVIQSKCECSYGYFQFDQQTCKPCISPCQTCEQDENKCITCVDMNQLVTDLHQCICKTGWIFNTDGITCIQCQLPCLSCVDTVNTCVTCQDQLHQQPNSCQCESGWINDNNYFCIPCQQPCNTCEISTSKCLTCLDINHELNNMSQCVCKSTYYSDSLITCAKCQEPCYQCDINGCINCIDINQILDSNKQCVCKPGYLQQGILCLQCQNQCSTCINTVDECQTCVDPNQIVKDYQCQCKEGFLRKGDYCCDQYCIDCQGIDNCNNCMKGFYLSTISRCLECIDHCDVCYNQVNCEICQDGYFINDIRQCELCISSCKVCNNTLSCDICFDGYYLLDQKCEPCNQNCLTCSELSEKCLTCSTNYEINSNNQCICKVGYYEQQNQCYKCEYPCKLCLSQTICQECVLLSNLHLDLNFQCNCISGYFWNNNSCSQCYESCLTCMDNQFNCMSCDQKLHRVLNNNRCYCTQDYFENEDGICISCLDKLGKSQVSCKYQDCKDLIWTYGEECDDGNDVNRDGCSNCKIDHNYSCFNEIQKQSICFQCPTNCISCQMNPLTNKSQCIKCKIGYFLNKNDCVECSINCFECIDKAQNCISCRFPQQKNHKCQPCESGYYADESNRTCLNKCGDYIKVKEEECDDGNLIKGDGCNDQCKLENAFIYLNGVSILPNYPKPLLQIADISQIYSVIRLFKLSYTTRIVIPEGFQIIDYLSFHIQNDQSVQQIDQQFQLTQEVSLIKEFNQSELSLMINISFKRSSQDEFLLIRFLNNSIIQSNEGYSQIEKEVSCLIPKVVYIDDVTIAQVQLTTTSNSYMLYFIGAMCGGSILFGGVEVFFNLLDTLQMLSYLKYINTQFPYNLQAYFKLFGFAQFNFIQKIFDFSGFIDQMLDIKKLKKIPTKIASDDITSLFIINAATIATVWISLFTIYAIAKVIPKILNSLKLKFYSESSGENHRLIKIGVYYLTIKFIINRLCFTIISEFFYSGILRAHMATAYDFTFSVILQLYALELNSPNLLIRFSSILACVAITIYVFSIYFVIKLSSMKKYAFNNQAIQIKYGSIFDGIKINQFSKYLNVILLIKKIIFMYLLIFAYEFPIFQTVSITFLSISMSLFYILFNPLLDKLEYYKQLLSEVSTSFTLLSITILTCDVELVYLPYEIQQYFGWSGIIFMTSILCIQLGIDGFQQWKFLFQKYKQIRRLAQTILRVFQQNNQECAPSSVFQ